MPYTLGIFISLAFFNLEGPALSPQTNKPSFLVISVLIKRSFFFANFIRFSLSCFEKPVKHTSNFLSGLANFLSVLFRGIILCNF